jgi:hypothetical protein
MATSTNYGWAEPDNSSLVKNGASDIRTLGNAIDTSVWNVGFGQAGKNKIINGDFSINQRGFTSNTTTGAYNFDRWLQQNSGGTFTVTPQTFTAGSAPVAGYESTNFLQGITATQSAAGDYAIITERIENVRTFAGNTVTISFYAKANTGTPKIGVEIQQNFGSGGSPSATVSTPAGAVTLTTSFARYSVTVAVPSISGKTVGSTANTSYLELNLWTSSGATNATRASSIGIQNFTASIWGVQVEYGSTATPFQIATATLATELAACQRYFYMLAPTTTSATIMATGQAITTTRAITPIKLPVTMRTSPSISIATTGSWFNMTSAFSAAFASSLSLYNFSALPDSISLDLSAGAVSFTAGNAAIFGASGSLAAQISISAEL